jgi:XTP/dITP diphosphohydrolase
LNYLRSDRYFDPATPRHPAMKYPTVLLASRNPDKSAELRALLEPAGIGIADLRAFPALPEVVEDGETLEENAMKKALSAHRATGFPAFADDTGLEVFYLLGRPGVHTARFAGPHASYADNCRKLLDALVQVPPRRRQARFRTVVAFVSASEQRLFDGEAAGNIAFAPRGANGFGYDPVFVPEGADRTFGEMTPEEKSRFSHRARAMASFVAFLQSS